jgi:hypothetical protein
MQSPVTQYVHSTWGGHSQRGDRHRAAWSEYRLPAAPLRCTDFSLKGDDLLEALRADIIHLNERYADDETSNPETAPKRAIYNNQHRDNRKSVNPKEFPSYRQWRGVPESAVDYRDAVDKHNQERDFARRAQQEYEAARASQPEGTGEEVDGVALFFSNYRCDDARLDHYQPISSYPSPEAYVQHYVDSHPTLDVNQAGAQFAAMLASNENEADINEAMLVRLMYTLHELYVGAQTMAAATEAQP